MTALGQLHGMLARARRPAALLAGALAMAILVTACAGLSLPGVNASAPLPPADSSAIERAPRVGAQAPDFSLKTLDGKAVSLSDYRGKPVFINFWATWCPPCRAEMPDIEAVHQEYKDRGLVVLGVDVLENPDTVSAYLRDRSFTWTFLLDEEGDATVLYQVTALPASIFVDRDGVIRAMQAGALTKSAMVRQITPLLSAP